jgi:hypothetical protein
MRARREHAFLDDVPGARCPRKHHCIHVGGGQSAVCGDFYPGAGLERDRASRAFDFNERLREVVGLAPGAVRAFNDADGAGALAEQHRGRIFSTNSGVAALRFRRNVFDFT